MVCIYVLDTRSFRLKRQHCLNDYENSPDVHSNHIFSVRLLDHVVCRVATSKCNVDIASSDDVCFIIVNGVGEHDVCLIRCLEIKTKQNKNEKQKKTITYTVKYRKDSVHLYRQ